MSVLLDPLRPQMWLLVLVLLLWFIPTFMLKYHHERATGMFWMNLLVGWIPFVWIVLVISAVITTTHDRPIFRAPWALRRRV